MFGLVGMKPIALRHKTNVELYDANYRRKTENYLWFGFSWWFYNITSVLQTILNVYEHDLSMQQAVNALFHQWLPDLITLNPIL
jgi:gamma-glutamyltranspeptidase/glutathione hydrolase